MPTFKPGLFCSNPAQICYGGIHNSPGMAPTRASLITEHGSVAEALLKSNRDESKTYDVIVVGSGMGGGTIAAALADESKSVLVLEAGSLLFPTHVGNLPRRLLIGKFQKHVWSLWERFSVKNYNNLPGSVYQGGQGFNLGGRSIFWGGSIPPLAIWELEDWPADIRDYLINGGGYDLARQTFNADVPELQDSSFHQQSVGILKTILGPDWDVSPGPVAVEYAGPTEWSVPAGLFSTADLLLEDVLVENVSAQQPRRSLTVNLNHAVWRVTFDPSNGSRATGVVCHDLLKDKVRTYRAKAVVIAAGALESPKIALQSGIQNDKLQVGAGIVDHAIYYRHFVVSPDKLKTLGLTSHTPRAAPPRAEPQSTKLLIYHKEATVRDYAFDVIVELGAQFNQGRFVDRDHIADDLNIREGYLLCEIVFQFYAPLMNGNYVQLSAAVGEGGPSKPVDVYMKEAEVKEELLMQARQVAKKVLHTFDALPVLEEEQLYAEDGLPKLQRAKVGDVAHEVGTLRMPVAGVKGVVDKDLKFEGYENLFACDNSVFPCSPAGNPSLTLVALARRCAKTVAALV